jgi:hypothetical protein
MPTSFTVSNETDLNSAIQQIDLTGSASAPNTNYTITFGSGLTGVDTLQLIADLDAINLAIGNKPPICLQNRGDIPSLSP